MFVKFKDDGYGKKYPGIYKILSIKEFKGTDWDYSVELEGFFTSDSTNIKRHELVNFNDYLQWLKQDV